MGQVILGERGYDFFTNSIIISAPGYVIGSRQCFSKYT